MLRFLENHDEQRIASDFFAGNPWHALPGVVLSALMHNGPFMIYFGQEIGEKAMDEEGFSGKDGRTTIFDYWCMKEYQKLFVDDDFNDSKLDENTRLLRNFYKKIIWIKRNCPAVSSGSFYDLMWVNNDGKIDNSKVFAFLRHDETQKLLIILNFDWNRTIEGKLVIPEHAFNEMQFVGENYLCKDIYMSEREFEFNYSEAIKDGFYINLPPCSSFIYEMIKK